MNNAKMAKKKKAKKKTAKRKKRRQSFSDLKPPLYKAVLLLNSFLLRISNGACKGGFFVYNLKKNFALPLD